MAKFKKGQSGNPKGRPPGPSEITAKLRESFKAVIADELDKLPAILNGLEPKERVELVIKLLPFCLPKLQPIFEHDNDGCLL